MQHTHTPAHAGMQKQHLPLQTVCEKSINSSAFWLMLFLNLVQPRAEERHTKPDESTTLKTLPFISASASARRHICLCDGSLPVSISSAAVLFTPSLCQCFFHCSIHSFLGNFSKSSRHFDRTLLNFQGLALKNLFYPYHNDKNHSKLIIISWC